MSHLDKTDCQPERGKAVTVHYVLQLWAARWYIAAVITRIGQFVCASVEATKLNALSSRFRQQIRRESRGIEERIFCRPCE
jgi:hypothetical protein